MTPIKIETKFLEKLVDSFGSAASALYEPTSIRRRSKAEADAMAIKAKSEIEILKLKLDAAESVSERYQTRIQIQGINRELNLQNIFGLSPNFIGHSDFLSTDPISIDWKTRYINEAQDINDQDLQQIWAAILAKELITPNSISLRTLDVLKNLNKQEAILFNKISSISLDNGTVLMLESLSLEDLPIDYELIMDLRAAGLVASGDTIFYTSSEEESATGVSLVAGEYEWNIVDSSGHALSFPCFKLTGSGVEINRINRTEKDLDYFSRVFDYYKTMSTTIVVTRIK